MKYIGILFFVFILINTINAQTIGYWKLNESSGSNVSDVSGNGNDGYADAACPIVNGFMGSARMVPDSRSRHGINVPYSPSLNIYGPFTLECFVKLDNYESNGIVFIRKEGNYGLGIGSYGSTGYLQLFIDPFVLQTDERLPLNKWTHIAATWDGYEAKLYIDYRLVKSQAYQASLNPGANDLWFASTGNDIQPTTQTFIDEIRISKGALSPGEFITGAETKNETDQVNTGELSIRQTQPDNSDNNQQQQNNDNISDNADQNNDSQQQTGADYSSSEPINTQEDNVNDLSEQPVWGPVGFDFVLYYYLPDIGVYYYVPKRLFFYFAGGRWTGSLRLPRRYRNYDLYSGYKAVINEQKPYMHDQVYRDKYNSYKNHHVQQSIRDSHDSKYFVIKNHPEHNNFVKQQVNSNSPVGNKAPKTR